MHQSLALLLLIGGLVYAQPPKALKLSARIDLPGVNGRIDHLSADLKGQRVFLAALGNQTVEVLDVKNGRRLHTIPNLPEPQGVYYDAPTNRLFVACAKDGTTRVFDAGSFQFLETVHFSGDADNIRYDGRDQRIVVGYGDGALGLLDPSGKKLGDIPLDAHPESFQLEKTGTRTFVNVPDRKQIEVVDLARKTVIAKWPVTSALKNYPMALDEPHRRLLAGCRAPARMLVFDTENGKQTAALEIAGDADDLFYDAARNRVYVIGGEGFLDVFEQKSADQYERIEHIATASGARTGLFVPDWGKLFVAVPHRGEQRAEVLIFQTN
jgi:DNA-binding beta-propeller fold protein YncE